MPVKRFFSGTEDCRIEWAWFFGSGGAGDKLGRSDPPSADWYDETSLPASGGSCQSTFER